MLLFWPCERFTGRIRHMAQHLGFRADDKFMERFKALMTEIQDKQAIEGVEVSQTQLLRALILRAMPLVEVEVTGRIYGLNKAQTTDLIVRARDRVDSLVTQLQYEDFEPAKEWPDSHKE